MNNEDKILSLLESLVSKVDKLEEGQAVLERDLRDNKQNVISLQIAQEKAYRGQAVLEKELRDVKDIVIRMENDHGAKLGALHDGYVQNASRLDRIEKEVTRHEEVILRRIP